MPADSLGTRSQQGSIKDGNPSANEEPFSAFAEAKINQLQADIDARLQHDGKVGESLKTATKVVQSVTPIVLDILTDAFKEVGSAHWTLLPLHFVGTTMDMCAIMDPCIPLMTPCGGEGYKLTPSYCAGGKRRPRLMQTPFACTTSLRPSMAHCSAPPFAISKKMTSGRPQRQP